MGIASLHRRICHPERERGAWAGGGAQESADARPRPPRSLAHARDDIGLAMTAGPLIAHYSLPIAGSMKLSPIWPHLERLARERGVARLGASSLTDEHAALFEEWIAKGHHATMAYLTRNAVTRRHPEGRFPWAKSAIVILVPYASERP